MHSDMLWLCCFVWRLSSSNTSRLLAVFSTHTIVLSFYITPTGVRSLWSSPRCLSHTMESSVVLCQASAALWKFQGPRWQHWIPGGLCVCERKMGGQSSIIQHLSNFFLPSFSETQSRATTNTEDTVAPCRRDDRRSLYRTAITVLQSLSRAAM